MGLANPPLFEDVAVPEDVLQRKKVPKLIMGFEWLQWFGEMVVAVDAAPSRQTSVHKTAQTASIGTTPLPLGSIPPGVWRVSYYARITTPGSVSSTLTVTISWTDGAIACSASGTAITGNTTATVQFGTLVIRSDDGTPISYATTYGSVGGTPMQYALDVVIESLALDTA